MTNERKHGANGNGTGTRTAIIIGSTRPGRNGEAVGKWVYDIARKRTDSTFELVDLRKVDLPLFDEPFPPSLAQYSRPHTRAWAAKIASFDAFVFVTAEYNHAPPASLKNAIDYLYAEWNNKAAGFVGYGSAGGTRAVEQLRAMMGELQIADVRAQVALTLAGDFKDYTVFAPAAHQEASVNAMLDQVIAWSGPLKALRDADKATKAEAAARVPGPAAAA